MKIHLSVTKPNRFGGVTTTSLCGRNQTGNDGMNLGDKKDVTCAFCAAILAKRSALYKVKS